MGEIRQSYLVAATSAVSLLRDPAVGSAWHKPSALTEFSVAGLAGHLAHQLVRVADVLASKEDGHAPIRLIEHYSRSPWVQAGLDHESNVSVRRGGEAAAADGAATLVEKAQRLLDQLTAALPTEPADRVVNLPWAGWSLRLDDFLLTRLVELVVHSDDLASSVGVETPELPAPVIEPVVELLARLAVHRHGPTAVIRTLSRAERAPATISAF
ncbi:maleylpyruvate isomerase N-terminal domain-containing protein [Nonomuraea jiangxiensis]|uniref:Mycothiol maleylpyruvate isomerase N-terminal domain-containing protein n=1 Tax=Nonomuraea jiangxiensis TaxID=633440 RepID=A0A1G8LMT2_9ACTN|nr:maleylpyruvate isomerase N-terminal domain-containing protein [Nonomuraea jiangxiensis]SDI56986.1 Mycothiol maleylpyruvate isomerase N-terminal domain-containing protein [Nonomuraea jiangxiensis]